MFNCNSTEVQPFTISSPRLCRQVFGSENTDVLSDVIASTFVDETSILREWIVE